MEDLIDTDHQQDRANLQATDKDKVLITLPLNSLVVVLVKLFAIGTLLVMVSIMRLVVVIALSGSLVMVLPEMGQTMETLKLVMLRLIMSSPRSYPKSLKTVVITEKSKKPMSGTFTTSALQLQVFRN